jgi:LacI family transcriptional regulator
MKVTIKDIARHAGVSYSTVSKALNDSPLVQPKTKQKIIEIARQMGYQPNIMAKSLVSRTTQTIGVAWPTLQRVALTNIVTNINEEIENRGYSMMISVNPAVRAIQMFERFQVEGIIVFDEQNRESKSLDITTDTPIIHYGVSQSARPTVDVSRRQAVFKAVEYLHGLGHRNIAYVGDLSHEESRQVEKYIGFTEAMISFGLTAHPDMLVHVEGYYFYDGYVGTKKLLTESAYRPTAIIGASYEISQGVVRAVAESGLTVPEDISVIGYDNIPEMANLEVPLTAVGAHTQLIAQKTVDSLFDYMDRGTVEQTLQRVDAQLVERKSCSSPPST